MLVNLKAEMIRFGVTAREIGKSIHKSERAVKSRIDGYVEISSDDIKKIRDTYFRHCTLDYLLSEIPCIVYPTSTDEQKPAS